jgi:hypothetical protein
VLEDCEAFSPQTGCDRDVQPLNNEEDLMTKM